VQNTISGIRSGVVAGEVISVASDHSSVLGGRNLTLSSGADRTSGFHADNATSDAPMTISEPEIFVLGNADLWLANTNNSASEIRLYEAQSATGAFPAAGTNYVGIKAPALAADYTLTLPTTDGDANQVLSTDGSGVLSWTDVAILPSASEAYNINAGAAPNYPAVDVKGQYIAFVDKGNDVVYLSDDSGATWTTSDPGISNPEGIAFTSDFGSIVVANAGSAGAAFRRSTNGGSSWADVTNPTTGVAIYNIFCKGTTFIALKGASSTEIARSTDSGATFSSVAITSASHAFAAADDTASPNTVWLVVASGTATAYRSTNDGATWSSVTLPFVPYNAAAFGFVNGKFRLIGSGGLYADSTTGASGSWTTHPIGFYSNNTPFRTSAFTAANGDYNYFIANGSMYKVHLENEGDVTASPITGGNFVGAYLVYSGGDLYGVPYNTAGVGIQSIFKITNIP